MLITDIESLMAGLPILSTPVCGVIDVVRHKENGLLTRDWSEEQFVKMLNDFENEHKTMKEVAKKSLWIRLIRYKNVLQDIWRFSPKNYFLMRGIAYICMSAIFCEHYNNTIDKAIVARQHIIVDTYDVAMTAKKIEEYVKD